MSACARNTQRDVPRSRSAIGDLAQGDEQTSPFAPARNEGPRNRLACMFVIEMWKLRTCFPAQVSLSRRDYLGKREARGSRIMPMKPQECRENGLRCRELAERATDSHLKDVLEELAKRWVMRATELERAKALRDANEPTPKR